MRHLVCTVQW